MESIMTKQGFKRGPMSDEHKAKISAANKGKGKDRNYDKRGGSRATNTGAVLWSKVAKGGPDECWPWRGYRNELGYGRVEVGGKMYYAHRVIFDLNRPGVIAWSAPSDRYANGFLRHSCDNPSCCNPAHLIVGTHSENMRDKAVRGRAVWWDDATGTPRAKLSADDVRMIRNRKALGLTYRKLQELLGVSKCTVTGVISGRHYKDIP
jgi:hypothetical protein